MDTVVPTDHAELAIELGLNNAAHIGDSAGGGQVCRAISQRPRDMCGLSET